MWIVGAERPRLGHYFALKRCWCRIKKCLNEFWAQSECNRNCFFGRRGFPSGFDADVEHDRFYCAVYWALEKLSFVEKGNMQKRRRFFLTRKTTWYEDVNTPSFDHSCHTVLCDDALTPSGFESQFYIYLDWIKKQFYTQRCFLILLCVFLAVLETKTEILSPGFSSYKINDLLYGRTYIFSIRPMYGEVEGPISTVYQRICKTTHG